MPNVTGLKWGADSLGTEGGVVSWSLVGAGEGLSGFDIASGLSVAGESFLSFDFRQVISDAFAAWSAYGDIEFIQVEDKGGAVGESSASDIRIFFGNIPGSTIGYAFFPTSITSAYAGDILFDHNTAFNTNTDLFQALALHEIGHALGLGHVDANSVMTESISGTVLQADDILGIQHIYGVQDNAPAVYHVKGAGNLTILEGIAGLHIIGNAHENQIIGSDEAEMIGGRQGDDSLQGNGGADILSGARGRDTLSGGAGADILNGGQDFDVADYSNALTAIAFDLSVSTVGTAGEALGDTLIQIERIVGGIGDDTLLGSDAVDRFVGGVGNDSLSGRGGDDRLNGKAGDDTLDGGRGFDLLVGCDGDDLLSGWSAHDTLNGGAGQDTLLGEAGNDLLRGGNDSDVLDGGRGNDVLRGGADADSFVFADGHGEDRIVDFEVDGTEEVIDLRQISTLSDFNDVQAASINTPDGVMIRTSDDDSIVLTGITLAQLSADDFMF